VTSAVSVKQYVHDIQLTEGHKACFGKSGGKCSETDCVFRDHCLETASTGSNPQQETAEKQVAQQKAKQATTLEKVKKETKGRKQRKAAMQESSDRLGQGVDNREIGTDISQEMADIFSMVKKLEAQVETSTKLNEDLNSNFAEAQQRLAEESATRTELEERMKTVEAQAAQADRLSKDIAYTENEQQKLSRLLAESHQQIQALTDDYELLTNRIEAAEERTKNAANLQTEHKQKMSNEAEMSIAKIAAEYERQIAQVKAEGAATIAGIKTEHEQEIAQVKAENTATGRYHAELIDRTEADIGRTIAMLEML